MAGRLRAIAFEDFGELNLKGKEELSMLGVRKGSWHKEGRRSLGAPGAPLCRT